MDTVEKVDLRKKQPNTTTKIQVATPARMYKSCKITHTTTRLERSRSTDVLGTKESTEIIRDNYTHVPW
ncbi:hypothetical protein PoB_004743900 [Plakobranchus ocellatus]|uniref:Uncharacterized protein n=1 Tax=Plakobranchus ocellatus TaxID=259542 RepID=A0AAV4BQ24_9GAST|nr:hypothetical protein PoB_004743900 [Plakobranchus ocellatus]